jgi:hypothetical protein
MPVDRRLLPVSSGTFLALLVGCGVGAGAPASVATGTPLAPVPSSTPVLTVPPQWADAVCAGYLTITIPVDLQDAADTNERTNEAFDARRASA